MKYDVVCIGNPLLDVTVKVKDDMLEGFGFKKGGMHLIDKRQSVELNEQFRDFDKKISAGGSSANVAAGIACLGGKAFFMGNVGEDANGKAYEKLMNKAGVDTNLATSIYPTGYALTFISPDYERTFATFLGAAKHYESKDLDRDALTNCKVLHFEGFQFEEDNQIAAALDAIKLARKSGALISVDLADSMFIEKNVEVLKNILLEYTDVVFANEREAVAFTGEDEPLRALEKMAEVCKTAIITLGINGSIISHKGQIFEIETFSVREANTNGAGDMYNAGFLFGMVNGFSPERSGRIASYAASKVVEVDSARLNVSLADEIKKL